MRCIDWLCNMVDSGLGIIKQQFITVWDGITGFLSSAWDTIYNGATNIFGKLGSAVSSVWDGIVGVVKGAINGIIKGINSMISGAVNGINKLIDGINTVTGAVGIPAIPTLTAPQIPLLAKGGIIRRADDVIVGERGPEMLRLPRGAQVTPLPAGAAAGENTYQNTFADGNESHAENLRTKARGYASHSEGGDTEANGDYSHSGGQGTIANGFCQRTGGRFNVVDNENRYYEIIGNGKDSNHRSNAYTLDRAGTGAFAGEVWSSGSRCLTTADAAAAVGVFAVTNYIGGVSGGLSVMLNYPIEADGWRMFSGENEITEKQMGMSEVLITAPALLDGTMKIVFYRSGEEIIRTESRLINKTEAVRFGVLNILEG